MKNFLVLIKTVGSFLILMFLVKSDELWEKIFPKRAERRSAMLWEEISAKRN